MNWEDREQKAFAPGRREAPSEQGCVSPSPCIACCLWLNPTPSHQPSVRHCVRKGLANISPPLSGLITWHLNASQCRPTWTGCMGRYGNCMEEQMIVLLERGPKEVAMLTGFGEGSTIGRSSGVGLQAEGTACAIVGDSVARSPHPRTGSRYRRCTGDLSHARRRRAFLPHWEQGSVSCKHCGDVPGLSLGG